MFYNDKYVFFYGSVFSQWAATPFTENGRTFATAEQYMMYHKATTMGDMETAKKIMDTTHPDEQKALGREIKPWIQEKWDAVKYQIVVGGNILKFSQNPDAFEQIMTLGKGRHFVEASPTDKIWGIGLSERDPRCLDEANWQGQNLLGKALDETYNYLYNKVMPRDAEV